MINAIPIWQPKYKTNEVLVDQAKITSGKNFLFFCADRNHTNLYSFDGGRVMENCECVVNGRYCKVYKIPMNWLTDEGKLPSELEPVRAKEYAKYQDYINNR